jgi:hypothetical protein
MELQATIIVVDTHYNCAIVTVRATGASNMNITLTAIDGLVLFGPFMVTALLLMLGFGIAHYIDNSN